MQVQAVLIWQIATNPPSRASFFGQCCGIVRSWSVSPRLFSLLLSILVRPCSFSAPAIHFEHTKQFRPAAGGVIRDLAWYAQI